MAASKSGLLKIDLLTGKPVVYVPEGGPVQFSDIKEMVMGTFG